MCSLKIEKIPDISENKISGVFLDNFQDLLGNIIFEISYLVKIKMPKNKIYFIF